MFIFCVLRVFVGSFLPQGFRRKIKSRFLSFLRRQESRETGIKLFVWIPAFAGMTAHYFLAEAQKHKGSTRRKPIIAADYILPGG